MTTKRNLGLFRGREEQEVQLCTAHWRETTGENRNALVFLEYLDDEEDECDVCSGNVGVETAKEACLPR